MKKALLALVALALLCLGTLLVAPALIDWNAYRRPVAAALAEATGRRVTIAGDLDLAILPLPRFTVRRVAVANIDGATDPDMLRIGELRMELAAAPLLTGRIAVRSLSLIDTEVSLETMADGRRSWDLAPTGRGPITTELAADVSVETISVSNGRVLWRATGETPRQLDAVDGSLTIPAVAGMVQLRARAIFETVPVRVLASIGRPRSDGTTAVSATIDLARGAGSLAATGRVESGMRRATGTVRLTSPDAARLAASLAPEKMPVLPGWPIEAESPFTLDRDHLALHEITASYGGVRGTGLADFSPGAVPALVAELRIGTMDLDRMLAAIAAPDQPSGPAGDVHRAWQSLVAPERLTADLELSVRAARWRGGVIRDIGASLRLRQDGAAIERLAVTLPGSTGVTLSGMARPEEQDIAFEGDLAMISDNLRAALRWLGFSDTQLPADRLRSFSYTSRVAVMPDTVHLKGIAARLDATRMTGAATIARQERPSFGLRLRLDRLGLDAYLPRLDTASGDADRTALALAEKFDANINLLVDSLTLWDKTVARVALDARLFDGNAMLRKLSIGDFGGGTLSIAGTIDDLPGAPLGDLELLLEAADAERFAGFIGLAPGPIAPRLGRFRITASASGTADRAAVAAKLDIAGGTLQADGTLARETGKTDFDLAVTLTHADGDRLLGLVAPGRAGGAIGATKLAFALAGTPDLLTVRDLEGTWGGTRIGGRIDLDLAAEHPQAIAQLSADLLDLDRLWPSPPRAFSDDAPPAARGRGRWSRETIDLSAIQRFDLDLTLRAQALRRGGVQIDGLDLHLATVDGVMTVDRLTGGLFGGTIDVAGRIEAAAATPAFAVRISGADVQVRPALAAIATTDRIDGPLSFRISLSAQGGSPFDLVSSLSGRATLAGRLQALRRGDRPIPAGAAGDALDALLKVFANAPAALDAELTFENGAVFGARLSLDGGSVSADSLGTVDLPAWHIDATTTVQRDADGDDGPELEIRIVGPLGDPAISLSGPAADGNGDEAPPPDAAPVIAVEPVAPRP